MSLFNDYNEEEYNEYDELFEDEEGMEIDDTLYDDDLFEDADMMESDFDEGEYYLDESIMEGAKAKEPSKIVAKLKELMKKRHAIAMQYRSRKAKKGKNKGQMIKKSNGLHRQLKYLTARAENGLDIINAKIERYTELLGMAQVKHAAAASIVEDLYESLLEDATSYANKHDEKSEKFKRYFVKKGGKQDPEVKEELKLASQKARFSSSQDAKSYRDMKERFVTNRRVSWKNLLTATKNKANTDKDILAAKIKYYTGQIKFNSVLAKNFKAYTSAYIEFVEGKLKVAKMAFQEAKAHADNDEFSKDPKKAEQARKFKARFPDAEDAGDGTTSGFAPSNMGGGRSILFD